MNDIDFREIAELQEKFSKAKTMRETYPLVDTLKEKYGVSENEALAILGDPGLRLPLMISMIDTAKVHSSNDMVVYVVNTNWADLDGGCCGDGESEAYFHLEDAKAAMKDIIEEERREGLINKWSAWNNFVEETNEEVYTGWLDGEFIDYHFEVRIDTVKVKTSYKKDRATTE